MAGTGDTAVGAVEGNFQAILLKLIVELQSMSGKCTALTSPTQGQQQITLPSRHQYPSDEQLEAR
jgi:hypothetical protein